MIRLELERRKRGIRLGELAGKASVSESLLSKVENGRRSLTPVVGQRVAMALGIPKGKWETLRKRV